MPTPHVRLYETEQQARDAAAKLQQEGFPTALVTPSEGDMDAAVKLGLSAYDAPIYAERVKQEGRSLVAATAPYGLGLTVLAILDEHSPIEEDLRTTRHLPDGRTPFSELLSWPVLTKRRTFFSRIWGQELTRKPGGSGIKLTSNPTPFSSALGLATLAKPPGDSSFGFPLLTRPAADDSFGFPLLTKNATPLSSMLGWPLLTDDDR
jgi:hypothetical protein